MSTNKPRTVNADAVRHIGGLVLAAQLAGHPDPSAIDDSHLDRLADLSVRAAMALDAAIPRAEARIAAEDKAADDKEKADKAAADKVVADEKAAAKDAETAAKTPAKPADSGAALRGHG